MRHFLQVIQRWFWVVALSAILLTGVAVGYSFYQTPVYEASAKIMIGQQRDSDASDALGSAVTGLQQLTRSMTQAVDTRPVAQGVIQKLNLQESPEAFLENLTAKQLNDTQFIEVSYLDTSSEQAELIVNAVGDEFSTQISDVSPTASPITATVWERAAPPDAPASPDPLRNGLLAFMIGGTLGVGLAFLLEYLDDSRRLRVTRRKAAQQR
ncbi:MAG: hypothetical protein H0T57_16955 [Rubrobacter sp.]|nr:hypothetical protein [Rubrobacter sp.]